MAEQQGQTPEHAEADAAPGQDPAPITEDELPGPLEQPTLAEDVVVGLPFRQWPRAAWLIVKDAVVHPTTESVLETDGKHVIVTNRPRRARGGRDAGEKQAEHTTS